MFTISLKTKSKENLKPIKNILFKYEIEYTNIENGVLISEYADYNY